MTPTAPTGGRGCVRGTLVTADGPVPDGLLAFEGTRITYAGPAAGFTANGWPEPASFPADSLLLPGLVDLHCHGALGCDFTSTADPGLLRRVAGFLHSAGTTTLLASLVSAPPAEMLAAAGRLGALAREGLVSGLHAEGPFLSAARPGAQAPDCLQAPDPDFVDALMEAADNELITMTFAPELPGADELLDRIISRGITPSIGHTDADDAVAAAALESARDEMEEAGFDGYTPRPTVTHLFNAMAPLHHRSPGPAAASLRAARRGEAVLELVADGMHLDPAMVRTVFELAGAGNVALVSDGTAAAGMGEGTYRLGPAEILVEAGTAGVPGAGGRIPAGGTGNLLDGVRTAVDAGVPLADAVAAASSVPADVLRLADEVGALRRGLRADALVVSPALELRAVLREGSWQQRTE